MAARTLRKTLPQVLSHINGLIEHAPADCTVEVALDGVPCTLEDLSERGLANQRVSVTTKSDTDRDKRRTDLFLLTDGGEGVASGTADILRIMAEERRQSAQTIADMHNVVRSQNEGTLAMAQAMTKFAKALAKSTKKQLKYREKLQEKDGSMGAVVEALREANDILGPERFDRLAERMVSSVEKLIEGVNPRRGQGAAKESAPDSGGGGQDDGNTNTDASSSDVPGH